MIKFFLITLVSVHLFAQSQNIGIGTTNPSRAKLELHGAVEATTAIFGGETAGISLQRNWPGIGYNSYYKNGHRYLSTGYGALQVLDPNSGYMAFDFFDHGTKDALVTSKRVMVISKEGGVHIGSEILPAATLSIARATSPDGTAALYSSLHHSFFNYGNEENTYIRGGKNNATVFINDIPGGKVSMHGYVGINTATPEYPLEIRQNGSGSVVGLTMVEPTNFNYWQLLTGYGGDLYFYCNGLSKGSFNRITGSYSTTSDRRLKTNITSLPAVLPKLIQIQPVQYEMKYINPEHLKSIGFIAQDIKNVFPQLVSVSDDSISDNIRDLQAVNYSGVGVLAIKGIQEQQQEIQSQNNTIAALQERLTRLEKLIKEKTAKTSMASSNK